MGYSATPFLGDRAKAGRDVRWRRKLALGALFTGVLVLAGCSDIRKKQEPFEGFYFKAKTGAVDKKETLAVFTATVSGVSQSLKGARQAAEYEGTKYCIEQYGNSRIDWTIGPDTAPESLRIVDDKLTFAGRCDP